MPYLNCPDCRLTVYSAARYSTADYCPACGAPLGAVGSVSSASRPTVTPLSRLESAGSAARSMATDDEGARPTA